MFDHLSSLEMLDLSDNQLTDLTVGVFDRLKSIKKIVLRNNYLDAITKTRLKRKFGYKIEL